MSNTELLHAFRKLYKSGLRAVQYSKPARYVLRDQLRAAFRGIADDGLSGPIVRAGTGTLNLLAVRRTVYFLNAAAQERGLEHRIVRNLVMTAWWRQYEAKGRRKSWSQTYKRQLANEKNTNKKGRAGNEDEDFIATGYDHYDRTIDQLNKTMNLCLR